MDKDWLIAQLQSRLDFIEAELAYVNELLISFGFPEGLESLKRSLEEILEADSP